MGNAQRQKAALAADGQKQAAGAEILGVGVAGRLQPLELQIPRVQPEAGDVDGVGVVVSTGRGGDQPVLLAAGLRFLPQREFRNDIVAVLAAENLQAQRRPGRQVKRSQRNGCRRRPA